MRPEPRESDNVVPLRRPAPAPSPYFARDDVRVDRNGLAVDGCHFPIGSIDGVAVGARRRYRLLPLALLVAGGLGAVLSAIAAHFTGFGVTLLLMAAGAAPLLFDAPVAVLEIQRGDDRVRVWENADRAEVERAADALGRALAAEGDRDRGS